MGCLGGFEVLGLVGMVVGPVLQTLAREFWVERPGTLADADGKESIYPVGG